MKNRSYKFLNGVSDKVADEIGEDIACFIVSLPDETLDHVVDSVEKQGGTERHQANKILTAVCVACVSRLLVENKVIIKKVDQ